MFKRRHSKQAESLQDRLASFANDVREKASFSHLGQIKTNCSGRHGEPILRPI